MTGWSWTGADPCSGTIFGIYSAGSGFEGPIRGVLSSEKFKLFLLSRTIVFVSCRKLEYRKKQRIKVSCKLSTFCFRYTQNLRVEDRFWPQ